MENLKYLKIFVLFGKRKRFWLILDVDILIMYVVMFGKSIKRIEIELVIKEGRNERKRNNRIGGKNRKV